MKDEGSVEAICLRAYQDTAALYAKLAPQMGGVAYGYKILYGPPRVDAQILFLGYQPAGAARDAVEGEKAGERIRWPDESEYATAPWRLATAMRAVWGARFLRDCVGLNSIFFRSPRKKIWGTLPYRVRVAAESFCLEQSRSIVKALRPRSIVMFGFGNVDDFQPIGQPLRAATSRLVQPGTIWGYPASEVIHLSGAMVSNENRRRIADYLKAGFSN